MKVVLTGEKGVWDREAGPRVELVREKVLATSMDTAFAGMGGGADILGVAPTGELYVVCGRDGVVRKLDATGKVALVIGRRGAGPGELAMPMGVAFDPEGNVCIVEAGNNRVSTFSPMGLFLHSVRLEPLGWPWSFAIDSAGYYYVAWYDAKEDKVIHKYNPEGRRVLAFGEPVRFREPASYAAAALKRLVSLGPIRVVGRYLYYSQSNPYEIRQYTTDGQLKMRIFRKQSFMEPARVRFLPRGVFELGRPTSSSRVAIWGDKIVNVVSLAPARGEPSKHRIVVDVFDAGGRLLTAITPLDVFFIDAIDPEGRVWGRSAAGPPADEWLEFHGRLLITERR